MTRVPRPSVATMIESLRKTRRGAALALHEARATYRRHSAAGNAVPAPRPPRPSEQPDVFLDVKRLHVDEIDLQVEELDARVALEAHLLDLLRIDVGVDARLRGVGLKVSGVDAEAQLRVRLENLTTIVDRVMATIDSNPQILEGLTASLGQIGSRAASAVETAAREGAALARGHEAVNGYR